MFETIINLVPVAVIQGLILSLIALGAYIPFRLLDLPDLSSEGSYPLAGAATGALLIYNTDPILATILSACFAGILGVGTALIHLRLGVHSLLAGILMSAIAYSVNLRLMGAPNIGLFGHQNLFSFIAEGDVAHIIFLSILVMVIIFGLLRFLYTEIGLAFRAVGSNPHFAQKQSINLKAYICFGLFIGNFLCGLAGSLIVQLQNYVDIGMGVGIVIHALAALMIGEVIMPRHKLIYRLAAPICGALVYQQIQGVALSAGFMPSDLKMLTAAIVIAVLALRRNAVEV